VDRLSDQAARLTAAGRPAEALAAQREAEGVVRSLRDAHPDDPRHPRSLAGLLYNMASSLNATQQFEAALRALDECEETYLALEARGEPGIAPLVADVHARKGLSHLARGYAASAICEVDEAVSAYKALGGEAATSPHHLDLARVLSVNGSVLHEHGDPALAVASADASIRMYLDRAAEINARPDSLVHTRYLRAAAGVASQIHGERGRLHLAADADRFAVHTATAVALASKSPADRGVLAAAMTRQGFHLILAGDEDAGAALLDQAHGLDAEALRRESAAWQRARAGEVPITLARALDAAARTLGAERVPDVVRGIVNDPMARATAVCASERCSLQVAPAIALMVAELAIDLLDADRAAALRLGLEAHCLFAASSRARVEAMRREFASFGGPWARLLLACSPAYLADGAEAMVRDLARWLGGVLQQLAPLAVIDPGLASLVAECEAHLQEHLR
jgi:tetratricopeptide (TPR) repeat protein